MPPKQPRPVKVLPIPGTIIRFDDVNDRAVVNQQYVSKGVTFRAVAATVPSVSYGDAYARAYGGAESPSNVISVAQNAFPAFDTHYGGAVEAVFSTPQLVVSIRARPTLLPEGLGSILGYPYLEAFNTAGALLGRAEFPVSATDPNWSSWQRVMFTSSQPDIRSVRFSSTHYPGHPSVLGLFDRLYFADKLYPMVLGPLAYFAGP